MKYRNHVIRVTIFCLLVLAGSTALAQYKGKAVKKEKLIDVLRARQLQTREIVGVIKNNGVDFRVDESVEGELFAAGARPEVIAAAKAHYRGDVASSGSKQGGSGTGAGSGSGTGAGTAPPAETGTGSGTGSGSGSRRFTGKPLDKDAILSLLENGMPEAQIVKNIQTRGVAFRLTAGDQQDIKGAGGSQALINVIGGSYAGQGGASTGGQSAGTGNSGGSPGSGGSVTPPGTEADDEGDVFTENISVESLQRSILKKPDQPLAYQRLGYLYLYGARNLEMAEKFYRDSIERGGSGVFQVIHDHGAGTFVDGCQGALYIAKDAVRFESYDNIHTFETPDSSIEKAKMNSSFASLFKNKQGSFSLKLKTGDKESKNFNFAPITDNPNEAKMLIRLIGKN